MTTTNYTIDGVVRKVDLYAMGPFNFEYSEVQRTNPTLAVESGGRVCSGIVKLAQKVVNTILAYNVYYDFDWGTKLSAFIMAGNTSQIAGVLGVLLADITELVTTQLRSAEQTTLPADERIGVLRVEDYAYIRAQSKVTVSFNLRSQSGEQITLVVPISIVP